MKKKLVKGAAVLLGLLAVSEAGGCGAAGKRAVRKISAREENQYDDLPEL